MSVCSAAPPATSETVPDKPAYNLSPAAETAAPGAPSPAIALAQPPPFPGQEALFSPGLDSFEDSALAGQIVSPPVVELVPEDRSDPAPAALSQPAAPAALPQITIDDFLKVELRVGQIKVAERIPKADKLLRLEVDLGYERRQILAGIAESYAPESLIGRKVVIVANLAPRKMRGLESNGMIVAASLGEQGRPSLASFLEDVELGARLK